jgi:hypothetical protein
LAGLLPAAAGDLFAAAGLLRAAAAGLLCAASAGVLRARLLATAPFETWGVVSPQPQTQIKKSLFASFSSEKEALTYLS